jgi:hypothetical protein
MSHIAAGMDVVTISRRLGHASVAMIYLCAGVMPLQNTEAHHHGWDGQKGAELSEKDKEPVCHAGFG